jgi:hypothetical protein
MFGGMGPQTLLIFTLCCLCLTSLPLKEVPGWCPRIKEKHTGTALDLPSKLLPWFHNCKSEKCLTNTKVFTIFCMMSHHPIKLLSPLNHKELKSERCIWALDNSCLKATSGHMLPCEAKQIELNK